MITPSHKVWIFVASDPVDFRKGHDGLAALVQSHLRQKPFDGSVKLRPIDLVEENPHAPSAALPLHEEHLIVNRGAVRAERAAARTREVLIAAGKKKRRSDDSPLSARRGMSAMFERLRL